MRGCLCLLLAAGLAQAGEYAVLSTGFRLHADRHERNGDTITLIDGGGSIELSASDVAGFEAEDPPPAPPPAPTPEPAPAAIPADPQTLVAEAARYAELPVALVASVARAESGFQVNAVSPKGALGVMQLMPSTAAGFQADPRDVTQNIYAGALYLRQLLQKYDGEVATALAAYNAGPGAVEKYHGVPPYRETRDYVNRVIRDYVRHSRPSPATPAAGAAPPQPAR